MPPKKPSSSKKGKGKEEKKRVRRVDMNQCLPGTEKLGLVTEGLASCIGIVAYGTAKTTEGINKVMAHISTVQGLLDARVMGQFEQIVPKIDVVECVVSFPQTDVVTDNEARASLLNKGYRADQIKSKMVKAEREALMQHIEDANRRCVAQITNLGLNPKLHPVYRLTRNINRASPFGCMQATASPGGMVYVENQYAQPIPDPPEEEEADEGGPSGGYDDGSGGGGGDAGGQNPWVYDENRGQYYNTQTGKWYDPRAAEAGPSNYADTGYYGGGGYNYAKPGNHPGPHGGRPPVAVNSAARPAGPNAARPPPPSRPTTGTTGLARPPAPGGRESRHSGRPGDSGGEGKPVLKPLLGGGGGGHGGGRTGTSGPNPFSMHHMADSLSESLGRRPAGESRRPGEKLVARRTTRDGDR